MDEKEILYKIEQLRKELEEHNFNYYVLNQPTISDFDFDMKLKELENLEKEFPAFADPNSPTQRVGSDISSDFEQVEHKYSMLSLSNAYTEDEIRDFDTRIKKILLLSTLSRRIVLPKFMTDSLVILSGRLLLSGSNPMKCTFSLSSIQ